MEQTQQNNQVNTRFRVMPPKDYDVIMHNDDVTTMDFVVMVLESIFRKSEEEAEALMLMVHNMGQAVAGTYKKDIAESKVRKATALARENGFPLMLTVEEKENHND